MTDKNGYAGMKIIVCKDSTILVLKTIKLLSDCFCNNHVSFVFFIPDIFEKIEEFRDLIFQGKCKKLLYKTTKKQENIRETPKINVQTSWKILRKTLKFIENTHKNIGEVAKI